MIDLKERIRGRADPGVDHGGSRIFYANGDLKSTDVVQDALSRVDASVTCFANCGECLASIRHGGCRLLVTNVPEPADEGIELLTRVKSAAPWVPVIMLVEPGRIDTAVRAMKAGATDCIERPPQADHLLSAVRGALHNSIDGLPAKPLTDVEQSVLQLILEGMTNGQIATALHRSRRTVEVHRADIMRKLGARHIVDLVRNAALAGLVRA
ncbi:response regulator transcription factor [Anaerobaca lacustris]|uniref:LuxR C-terminal-related transcriptional regulator n=1 Tax=Anaerobaca lacustris TaxID=3044600 RepID=A0AAW6U549_9BACT|nr:LuxR C-terminal-related transcriptional regulator [Sedimentisphaerales bacterium M17dextr]